MAKEIHFNRNPDTLRVLCGKLIVKRFQTTIIKLVTCPECRNKLAKPPEEVYAELEKRGLA